MYMDKKIAWRIIYFNVVFTILLLCLGVTTYIKKQHRYDDLIVRVAHRYKLNPRLITAQIWTESRFDPGIVGKAGEIGLMQVGEAAAREWAHATDRKTFRRKDLYDPVVNVNAGCWYLKKAINYWAKSYPDPLPYALAEYNAGRANAIRWSKNSDSKNARIFWEKITYPTTKKYIVDILQRYRGGV